MKKQSLMSLLIAIVAMASIAEASLVTNVAVRQRWPWSDKVDIDYIYTGEANTNMSFTATYRGCTSLLDLVGLASAGAFNVQPGQNRFEWDPASAGLEKQTLLDFNVNVTPCADARTYLVLDLANGGYSFLADVPAGGWTSDHKLTKMVFRRIPAGPYSLGMDTVEQFKFISENGTTRPIVQGGAARTVTITSDFYLQIFATTSGQVTYFNGDQAQGASLTPSWILNDYELLRGTTLDDGETAVDWPTTGHNVASASFVGRLRALSAQTGQDQILVDLPTDAQWEVGMRAGTTTVWPNGGTGDTTTEEFQTLATELFWAKSLGDEVPTSYEVGLKAPNCWGLYDYNIRYEPTLDWANDKEALTSAGKYDLDFPAGGVDPIGPSSSNHDLRVFRGGDASGSTFAMYNFLTTKRTGVVTTNTTLYTVQRYAIHLKPLAAEAQ
ncbi:MAG: SUMF1/EgtB/PvdO family nonheme iron enzyme [Kiritimatiellia bacterium]